MNTDKRSVLPVVSDNQNVKSGQLQFCKSFHACKQEGAWMDLYILKTGKCSLGTCCKNCEEYICRQLSIVYMAVPTVSLFTCKITGDMRQSAIGSLQHLCYAMLTLNPYLDDGCVVTQERIISDAVDKEEHAQAVFCGIF